MNFALWEQFDSIGKVTLSPFSFYLGIIVVVEALVLTVLLVSIYPWLKKHKTFWKTISQTIADIPYGFVLLDEKGKTKMVNKALCDILGVPADRLVGESFLDSVSRVFGTTTPPVIQSLETGEPQFEVIKLRINGSLKYVQVTSAPVQDRGKSKGAFSIVRDVTNEQLANKERLTTKRALLMLRDDITILDADGRIVFSNRLPQTAVGKDYVQFLFDGRRLDNEGNYISSTVKVLETGQDIVDEVIEKYGRIARVTIRRLYDEEQNVQGVISVYVDVTQDLLLRQELQRVDQLSSLGEIASTAAHELRNPLSAIRAMAQLGSVAAPEKKDALFNKIIGEIDQLDIFVGEMTSLSKPVSPEMTIDDLHSCIDRVLTLMHGKMRLSGVKLYMNLDPSIPAFRFNCKLMRQALINLVTNAVEAMGENGFLSVSTFLLPGKNKVRITVKDNGAGIPPDLLAKIFAPFFTTKQKGTGIGLAVTHQIIVDYHKGDIWFESEVGKGTTAVIELPIS